MLPDKIGIGNMGLAGRLRFNGTFDKLTAGKADA